MKVRPARTAPGPAVGDTTAGEPAPASRATRPGWRDPRILVGVAIMAVSVLAGAWLMASSDDTTGVLVVRRDLPAGARLTAADVESRQVHFADDDLADRYVAGSQDLPDEAALGRPLRAGELVPRSALQDQKASERVEVPLSVEPDDLPATVSAGSVVDVWVLPDGAHGTSAGSGADKARLVLAGVTVLRLAAPQDTLAPQTTRQVIVTVPSGSSGRLAAALGRTSTGRIVLTRRG